MSTAIQPDDQYPDPRQFKYIRLGDLHIDRNAQRGIKEWKVRRMVAEWSWVQAEVPTVTWRDGNYYVVEAQHRITTMQLIFSPDAMIMCAVITTEGRRQEAEIALAITQSRRKHSAFEVWQQAVRAGHERELAAEAVLNDLGLQIADSSSKSTISGAATISKIIHAKNLGTSWGAAEHLRTLLTIIQRAYPDSDDKNVRDRFDNRLLQAVNLLVRSFPTLDSHRLADKLGRRPAVQWINAASGVGPWSGTVPQRIAQELLASYNRDLRTRRLQWGQ